MQEDVQGVAVSSYQGGHVEYFQLPRRPAARAAAPGHVKVYGGGGGVIVPDEIAGCTTTASTRIFSPDDGHALGLVGMINTMVEACDVDLAAELPATLDELAAGEPSGLARVITGARARPAAGADQLDEIRVAPPGARRARARHHRHRRLRASRRSPTSSCGASASTRRTSSGSRCWPSIPPGARAAGRCSATASG